MGEVKKTTRADGYVNAFLGWGMRRRDPFESTFYKRPGYNRLSDEEADDLFTYNGIAQKIIKAPADEAVRAGFTLQDGDADIEKNDDVQSVLEDLNWQAVFSEALCWDRLFGGGAVFMLVDDGQDAIEPLDLNRARRIERLEVFDAPDISFVVSDTQDPHDEHYGRPDFYTLTGYNGGAFDVHASRLLLFDGGLVSHRKRRNNNGWGGRVFDQIQDNLKRYDVGQTLSNMALNRLSQSILKLSGMSTLLQNDFGEKQVQRRLQVIDMARSIMNTIALDSDDEYDIKNMSLAGVRDIIEMFENAVCAAADMPATILFGRSPDGQNATGKSDLENYYNMVGRIQQRKLKPQLTKLLNVISACSDYGLTLPDTYTIHFNELWNPSELEQANTENIRAQAKEHEANTAQTYVNMHALDAMEVRDKLDKDDVYDLDRSLDKIMSEPVQPQILPGEATNPVTLTNTGGANEGSSQT